MRLKGVFRRICFSAPEAGGTEGESGLLRAAQPVIATEATSTRMWTCGWRTKLVLASEPSAATREIKKQHDTGDDEQHDLCQFHLSLQEKETTY